MTETTEVKLVTEDGGGKGLAVVTETDGDLMIRWDEGATAIRTNLDVTNSKGRALMTRCMATADIKTRNAVGQPHEVTGYMAHVVEIADMATGEVFKRVRVVLTLADGRTLSTTSNACVRAISLLAQATKGAPWDPPIIIEIREHPLDGGKSYCDLREIERTAGQTQKKKTA